MLSFSLVMPAEPGERPSPTPVPKTVPASSCLTFRANRLEKTTASGITTAQNWSVALQWGDAFGKGHSLGMAVDQPTFVTAMDAPPLIKNDGYSWEGCDKFQIADSTSVTPAIVYFANPAGLDGFSSAQIDPLSTTNPPHQLRRPDQGHLSGLLGGGPSACKISPAHLHIDPP